MIPWPTKSPLAAPLAVRQGLGRLRLMALAKKGLISSLDLLLVPPVAYRDRRRVDRLAFAEDQQRMVFVGQVIGSRQGVSSKGRHWLRVEVEDGPARAGLWWFNQIPYVSQLTKAGQFLYVSGQVTFDERGQISLTHPEISPYTQEDDEGFLGIKPVYRLYPGVPPAVVKRILSEILKELPAAPKVLPEKWLAEKGLPDPLDLLKIIHEPPNNPGPIPHPTQSRAYRQLATYELAFWRLLILSEKKRRQTKTQSKFNRADPEAVERFFSLLPFEPTPEQTRATKEFMADLSSHRPLNRLLQGEVGSGKTAVAGALAAGVVAKGRQAAFLAPTELLARQHYAFLSPIFAQMGLTVGLLCGTLTPREKREALSGANSGELSLVIGTQALLSDAVTFKDLALAVIDEQQRFGVRQRMALAKKSPGLDLMSMSATPIPRSLAQVLYGDLDVTSIHGSIPGRLQPKTVIFDSARADEAYSLFLDEVRAGQQGFVVCPRVGQDGEAQLLEAQAGQPSSPESGPSEDLFAGLAPPLIQSRRLTRDVTSIEKALREIDPNLRIGMVHGRHPPALRQEAMESFRAGGLDILVASTIVEVGVDVPGANLMLVEAADLFGLSQLHQLRGRVGRGGGQGLFLAVRSPFPSETALARLAALTEYSDGYQLAEIDLSIRGPGEELGLKQSGWPVFRFVQLPQDLQILPKALEMAEELWPRLDEWPDLKERLAALAKELAVLPDEAEGGWAN